MPSRLFNSKWVGSEGALCWGLLHFCCMCLLSLPRGQKGVIWFKNSVQVSTDMRQLWMTSCICSPLFVLPFTKPADHCVLNIIQSKEHHCFHQKHIKHNIAPWSLSRFSRNFLSLSNSPSCCLVVFWLKEVFWVSCFFSIVRFWMTVIGCALCKSQLYKRGQGWIWLENLW